MEGNQMKMREALIEIDRVVWDKKRHTKEETEAHRLATEALTVPARQCDVGTALEQALRFHDLCVGNSSGINGMCKPTCPCIDCFDKCQCLAKWAQMPYEAQEGGAS